jgi:hypothetical protein
MDMTRERRPTACINPTLLTPLATQKMTAEGTKTLTLILTQATHSSFFKVVVVSTSVLNPRYNVIISNKIDFQAHMLFASEREKLIGKHVQI